MTYWGDAKMDAWFDYWLKTVGNAEDILQEAAVERIFHDMIKQSAELKTIVSQYEFADRDSDKKSRRWLEDMVQRHLDNKRGDRQREQLEQYSRAMARGENPNKKEKDDKKNKWGAGSADAQGGGPTDQWAGAWKGKKGKGKGKWSSGGSGDPPPPPPPAATGLPKPDPTNVCYFFNCAPPCRNPNHNCRFGMHQYVAMNRRHEIPRPKGKGKGSRERSSSPGGSSSGAPGGDWKGGYKGKGKDKGKDTKGAWKGGKSGQDRSPSGARAPHSGIKYCFKFLETGRCDKPNCPYHHVTQDALDEIEKAQKAILDRFAVKGSTQGGAAFIISGQDQ